MIQESRNNNLVLILGESEFRSAFGFVCRLLCTSDESDEKPSNGPSDANDESVFNDSSFGRIDVSTE